MSWQMSGRACITSSARPTRAIVRPSVYAFRPAEVACYRMRNEENTALATAIGPSSANAASRIQALRGNKPARNAPGNGARKRCCREKGPR
jgi:hypothetical protein